MICCVGKNNDLYGATFRKMLHPIIVLPAENKKPTLNLRKGWEKLL